jgi:hypothetical protein
MKMTSITEIRKALPTEARKHLDTFLKLGRYPDGGKLHKAANKVHDLPDDVQDAAKNALAGFGFGGGSVVARFNEIVREAHLAELSARRQAAKEEYAAHQTLLTQNGFYG